MTRESKLALIIGFVLVLVVGVLVSDHFSQASTMSLDLQDPQGTRAVGLIADLGQREQQGLDSALNSARNSQAMGASAQPTQSTGPVVIANGRGASTNARTNSANLANSANSGNSILDRAFDHVQDLELPRAAQVAPRTLRQNFRPLPEVQTRTYKVVAGDTLIGIARRALGDGTRWTEIHQLNADVLGPDAILKIGVYLKLPRDAKAGDVQSSNPQREASSKKTYTVVSGDTLGEISMRFLGTSKRANEIAKLNGLESANDIRIGMTLKIPAK